MNQQAAAHVYNLHLGQPDMHISNISAITRDGVILSSGSLRVMFYDAIIEWVREVGLGPPRVLALHPSNNESGPMRKYYAFVNWGSAEKNRRAEEAMHTQEFLNQHIRVQFERRPPIVRVARPMPQLNQLPQRAPIRPQNQEEQPQEQVEERPQNQIEPPQQQIEQIVVVAAPINMVIGAARNENMDDDMTVVGVRDVTACLKCGREDTIIHLPACEERGRQFQEAHQREIERIREATCGTCLSHFWQTAPHEVMTLMCGHMHHRMCIERHMGMRGNETRERCPGCRRPIEEFVRYFGD